MILKLYNIAIQWYAKIVQLAAFRNKKAKLWVLGRSRSFAYLEERCAHVNDIVWIHCPSLGEFEQARPLIETIKKDFSTFKVLVTFYSPSGYEIRKDDPMLDYVCYLPLDTRENARRFLDLVKPVFTFFVKYDFWANYLKELQGRGHKHYVISAIFRNNHYFFKKKGAWMLEILSNIDHFFVQNEDSKYMLLTKNITQVSQVGDTRFDRVLDITKNVKTLPILESFKQDTPLFIGGSTWPKGEEILIEFMKHYGQRFKYVVASHEIHESSLHKFESLSDFEVLRYSKANAQNAKSANLLVIDNIGLLSSLYSYADIAYIGGGFGKGIHNTLEAATFGMPIFIGPKNEKFQEAVDLMNLGVATEIKSAQELIAHCDRLLVHPTKWDDLKVKSSNYVKGNAGATEKIVKHVFS